MMVNNGKIFPKEKSLIKNLDKDRIIIGNGSSDPLKLGENLYINLIIAKPLIFSGSRRTTGKPDPLFPQGELLAYDLELFDNTSEVPLSLKDLGLLSGERSIIYQSKDYGLSLPTIFLPDDKLKQGLNILYGSCRKLHGDELDSIMMGDQMLSASINDLEKRPSVFFLIGDQIYADDVADPLIKYVTKLGNVLLGWEEHIQGINKKLIDLEYGERQKIVKVNANFSSENARNHLLSFSEFVAMYVISWNPEIWPNKYDDASSQNSSLKISRKYKKQVKSIERNRKVIFALRRLFANIPTYMICDDHDITDDWNIDGNWYSSVKNSRCGRQIISNGLVAYWAFQAWGNDPKLYDSVFFNTVFDYLTKRKEQSQSFFNQTLQQFNDYAINEEDTGNRYIRSLEDNIWNFKRWIFVAPTKPLTIILDTRTQRDFTIPHGPPKILNNNALTTIVNQVVKHGYKNKDPLIIVSATPVFGFELAEKIQRFLSSISGTYKWDLETWKSNEEGFVDFLTFIIKNLDPSYCIFLSGDVHYGFTMKVNFSFSINKDYDQYNKENKYLNYSLPIAQLTSSPLISNLLLQRLIVSRILNFLHKLLFPKEIVKKGSLYLRTYEEKSKKNICNKNNESVYNLNHQIPFSNIDKKNTDSNKSQHQVLHWSENKSLVRTRGTGTSPILSNNNIGLVNVNSITKVVKHRLYYMENNKMKYNEGTINL